MFCIITFWHFPNLKSGFLPFNFKEGKEEKTTIDTAIFNEYVEQLVLLLNEILDVTKTFKEKV